MWYNKYIGIPYKDNGRDYTGVDCWGLVRLIYKDEYGIELPSFAINYFGAKDVDVTSELIAQNKENWQQNTNRVIGSVVLFKVFGTETHVGVYIGNNKFIHAKQGHSSTIESLESTMWNKRIVGFYSYSERSNLVVTAVPSALRTQKYLEVVEEGTTLRDILDRINEKYQVSKKIKAKLVVLLNGKLASEDDWNKKLTRFDSVEYRLVPEGDNPLRSVLMIVVAIAAIVTGQVYLNSVVAPGATATVGQIATAAAISVGVQVVGTLLVDAIAPIVPPTDQSGKQAGSPVGLNMFTGGSNRAVPYGIIPVVLGKLRITPPLASSSLIQAEMYSNFLKMNLCWGLGPLEVDETTFSVGGIPINEYVGVNDVMPEIITVDSGFGTTPQSVVDRFDTLFSTDIKQIYPNAELAADGTVGIPGPWREEVLLNDEKTNKFTVTLNFPEGLRKVYTRGSSAGSSEASTATFELEYAKKLPNGSYEAWKTDGTTASSSRLDVSTAYTLNKPTPVAQDYDTAPVTVGRWLRIGIRRNSLVGIAGIATDNFTLGATTATASAPSTWLQTSTVNNSYSALLGYTQTFTVYPQFDTTATDTVIPLVSAFFTSAGDIRIIDDLTGNAQYTKSGLTYTVQDSIDPEYGLVQKTITFAPGYVQKVGANQNIISITQLKKDAFNYVTREIEVPEGDYKIRIRRVNEAIVDIDDVTPPSFLLSNARHSIPTTNSLLYTSTKIIVRQGEGYLNYTTNQDLEKGEWRILSIVKNNVTTETDHIADIRDGIVTTKNITGLTTGAATYSITYQLEVMGLNGTTYTPQLVQTFTKFATYQSIFNIESDNDYVFRRGYQTGTVRFWRSTPTDQQTSIRSDLPVSTYYYTVFEASQQEGAAQLLTQNYFNFAFDSTGYSEAVGLTLYGLGVIAAPTFVQNVEYTYKIRLYVDEQKSALLDEIELKYRHAANDITPYRNFSRAVLYAVTGFSSEPNYISPKIIVDGQPQPVKIARTALNFQSSGKINGQIDGINGIVQSLGFNWYPSVANPTTPEQIRTGEWRAEKISNPASLFLYVLTHVGNAYRVKADTIAELADYIDMNAVKEWHYYCRQKGFSYNKVLDNVSSVMDILREICAAGRASPTMIDGKWSVIVDKPKTDIIQHFTPYNSWGFEATKGIPRIPDAFRTTILDEDNGYKEAEVVVYNSGKTFSTAEIFEEITLPGITNKDIAIDHLRWHLAQLRYRPERYVINTDIEYIVCNRGDRVKVAHDVPLWGTASGRFASVAINGSQRQVSLDDAVLLNANTSYVIRVRLDNGKFELGTVQQVAQTTYYDTLTYTITQAAASGTTAAGNLFLIGTTDTAINDLMVLSIEPLDNKNARITLVDYAPGIFTEDLTTTYSNITYTASAKPPTNLENSIVIAPISATFSSGQALANNISPSVSEYGINVSLVHHPDLNSDINGVEIQYIPSASTFEAGINVKSKIFLLAEEIVLTDIVLGTEYKIRIRYTGTSGRIGPWMQNATLNYFTFTPQANSINNDNPDAIEVDLDRTNLLITLIRTTELPSNFSHYEIRVLKDPDSLISEDFWYMGDDPNHPQYGNISKITTISGQTVFSLLNFTAPRFDANGVMYRIACRSVDTSNNVSRVSLLKSYLLTPLE